MQNTAETPIFILKAILVFQINLANLTMEENVALFRTDMKTIHSVTILKKGHMLILLTFFVYIILYDMLPNLYTQSSIRCFKKV